MADMVLKAAQIQGTEALPLEIGEVTLSLAAPVESVSVTPFKGQRSAVSDALAALIGADLPEPGHVVIAEKGRIVWMGRNVWHVEGLPRHTVVKTVGYPIGGERISVTSGVGSGVLTPRLPSAAGGVGVGGGGCSISSATAGASPSTPRGAGPRR